MVAKRPDHPLAAGAPLPDPHDEREAGAGHAAEVTMHRTDTISFHCPHPDCDCAYVAPRLSLETRRCIAEALRKLDQLGKTHPLPREDRKKWSTEMSSLRQEAFHLFHEAAGEDASTACLGHLSRPKDQCFACGEAIAGNDLVYCRACGTPNFNW